MRLSELTEGLIATVTGGNPVIKGLCADSRAVKKGDLFFAVKGERFNGNEFIHEAIKKGAVAVVSEESHRKGITVPYVQVQEMNDAMAYMAARFFGKPSQTLSLVGITGTNGKTTTSYLLYEIIRASGKRAGLLGTIRYIIDSESVKAPLTTPQAVEFQHLLFRMVSKGVTHAVAEVSSHALTLKRVDYTRFAITVFTNLTRDHLDFHGDMEAYFQAKRRLFFDFNSEVSVINQDDPYGRRLYNELKDAGLKTITFGLDDSSMCRATGIRQSIEGTEFAISFEDECQRIFTPMIGITNVYNILASVAVARTFGIEWEYIKKTIEGFSGVEGRMEPVRVGQDFLAIIDYAHTPDALMKVIQTLRGIEGGRLITVFGCGGDRDKGKRALMGDIASRLSDVVVITSDNPRSESPDAIIEDIRKGIKSENYMVEVDRREAIRRAVSIAGEGDVVLVAGKGHEDYQEINGVRYPFSDREVLKEAILELKGQRQA